MHEVGEYKIRHNYLHENISKPESNEWDSEEVEQVTDAYYEFVVETIEEFKKSGQEPLALIEAKLNYTHIAPGGFGTGDVVKSRLNYRHSDDLNVPNIAVSR